MKRLKLPYWFDKFIQKNFSMIYGEIKVSIHDVDGILVHEHKQIAHSVTANFLSNVYMQFHNFTTGSPYEFTAPFPTNRSLLTDSNVYVTKSVGTYMRAEGAINLDTTGIIVGRGSAVVAPSTANLTTKITHGSGANQLLYMAQSSPEGIVITGNQSAFRLIRTFLNSSGSTVNVSEVGILQLSSDRYLLFIDPITPAQDVLDGQTLTLEITFTINT